MSKRPFDTVSDMNDAIIKNWNRNINKDDTIYILGDFGDYNYAQYLNGHKILIPGNYEMVDDLDYIKSFDFDKVTDEIYTIDYLRYKINMVHEPMKLNKQYMADNEINLFGHIHKLCMVKKFGLNVGADCHNFTPIDLDTVLFYIHAIKEYYSEDVFV